MDESRFRLDDFELYCHAREFRKKVYRLLRQLPAEEKYCLGSQMRRAAISITNNIAEGHGRWHYQENLRFCRISRGSVDEVLDDINTCDDENYGEPALRTELKNDAYLLIRKINSYMAYLQKVKQGEERDHT